MIDKLQSLKCKTKLKLYRNISIFFDGMNYRIQSANIQFEENVFGKNSEGFSKHCHEVLKLLKFWENQTSD